MGSMLVFGNVQLPLIPFSGKLLQGILRYSGSQVCPLIATVNLQHGQKTSENTNSIMNQHQLTPEMRCQPKPTTDHLKKPAAAALIRSPNGRTHPTHASDALAGVPGWSSSPVGLWCLRLRQDPAAAASRRQFLLRFWYILLRRMHTEELYIKVLHRTSGYLCHR